MSDSISIIMSTLSAIQCQLQPEAPNSSPKKDFVDVHVSLSNHEVEKDGISGVSLKKKVGSPSLGGKDVSEGFSNEKTPNAFPNDKETDRWDMKYQKSDACKILDDNDNKNEDSTNQYDRFDDIIGNYNENFSTKKQNIVELSDDASSPQKLAKPNEAKKLSTLDEIIRHETFGIGQDVDIPLMKEFEVTTFLVAAQNN
ncbi:hypothetical protein LINPERPRIM_LOCUS5136, partial [Linum perenne]